ncbi:alkaline ceramidase-like [Hibiscus syriacus]|uniref:alkaline ceramidase-like n=1 Tax=Hibiscus syriacus TaxID=106335 RepID=UPI00192057EA|nr:alkaline ceramidase-like [Hibiscus syriacus]
MGIHCDRIKCTTWTVEETRNSMTVDSSYPTDDDDVTQNSDGVYMRKGMGSTMGHMTTTMTTVIAWEHLGMGMGSEPEGQQQGDETPMVWEMLLYFYILYSPDWHYRSTMPTFLFFYGVGFAVVHALLRFGIGFKVHYVILCLLCIPRMYKYYIYTKDAAAKRLARLYIATLLLGSICGLSDRVFCKHISQWYFNPQGHALWHVFMGFNSYFANTFLMFCRARQREWDPKIVHFLGVLPYVKIQKPKSQ